MEDLRAAPAPAASAAQRGRRVAQRRRNRWRLRRLGLIAGVLLLLSTVITGLVVAQRGVADLAGPGAPTAPIDAACDAEGCWVAAFGYSVGISVDAFPELPYSVITWLSRKSIRWR